MFGVLLESRSRRQRRNGGVALSVAMHLAIIGVATAATTAEPRDPPRSTVDLILLQPPPPKPEPPTPRRVVREASSGGRRFPTLPATDIVHIDVPTTVPVELPAIDPIRGASIDSLVIGSTPGRAGGRSGGFSLVDSDDQASPSEWRGNELLMRMVSSGKPRYPETLRQSGIDGRVLIRFTVDTLGRIDPVSVAVVSSTHELFSQAVRASLPAFRFRPAEAGGRRVQALAEMPFEFALKR